jgi:photoactive yellow protein
MTKPTLLDDGPDDHGRYTLVKPRRTEPSDPKDVEIADLRLQVAQLQTEMRRLMQQVQHQRNDFLPAPWQAQATSTPPTSMPSTSMMQSGMMPSALMPPRTPTSAIPMAAIPAAVAASQGLDFGAIQQLSGEALDAVPYGLITVDAEGRVIHYNDIEARYSRVPREAVIGKNFFTDVAPCTRLREFEGRFRALVDDPIGLRVQTFDFVFRFSHGAQHVSVVITPARKRGQYHLAFMRRIVEAG